MKYRNNSHLRKQCAYDRRECALIVLELAKSNSQVVSTWKLNAIKWIQGLYKEKKEGTGMMTVSENGNWEYV
jgi:hypothetical protein